MKYIIAGAGIFSCVVAERIAAELQQPVEIYERRGHIGGNCYSYIDDASGIECHQYGSHIFHTKNKEVWDYLNKFISFSPYRHRVLAKHGGKTWPLPISLAAINAFYGLDLSPDEARGLLKEEAAKCGIVSPRNLEEKALSLIGRPLYEAFIKNYTAKQWNRDPRLLPESIINRIPARFNYNTDYFDDYWQGMPLDGYGALFKNLLKNPLITVHLNQPFTFPDKGLSPETSVIYTGAPDALFNYKYGRLSWRSLRFEWERLPVRDFQGASVINYCDSEPAFTRIHEFKHYHPERKEIFESGRTVICREYPEDFARGREPYYPVNDLANNGIYELYKREAANFPNLCLGGRLGSYRYWNMDEAVAGALELFNEIKARAVTF